MRNSRSSFFLILAFFIFNESVQGQKDLKAVEDETTALLGSLTGNTSKMEKATLTKEDERSITVSLRFSGFEDKVYKIQVAVLNSQKAILEGVSTIETDMPKSKQVDLSMNMANSGKSYAQSFAESKYLRVRVAPQEAGIAGVLSETFDDLNLNAREFIYELPKKWMLTGSNVKMNVKLTPFKNAANISPN